MVGVWGGRDRNYAAMKMTIYLTLGAMLSLIGLIAIYVKSGANSFDLITLRHALADQPLTGSLQKYCFGLLMFGFGILVSIWPLHTWAPLGYGAAPSSAANSCSDWGSRPETARDAPEALSVRARADPMPP